MTKIKDITWVKCISDYSETISYSAMIRDIQFLFIVHADDIDKGRPKYYIHTTWPSFPKGSKGKEGASKWGWFDDLEECKIKAEELIREEILSFIDIRDYKIDELLKK